MNILIGSFLHSNSLRLPSEAFPLTADPRLNVRRLLNGLHATVTPIDGLIRRLGTMSTETRLSMILQAGMVGILRSIDSIADELEPFLSGQAEVPAREDFGVYDPGTD